jgi:hypothetical protein
MAAEQWLQLFLTVCGMIVAMAVFYFKSEAALRREIHNAEERLRGGIDGVKEAISKVATRVAVLEALEDRASSHGE